MQSQHVRAASLVLVLSLTGWATAPSFAEEPIRGMFGQVLGEVFDPARAILTMQDKQTLVFGFTPAAPVPYLAEYTVSVAPLSYRIYAIQAHHGPVDPEECRRYTKALTAISQERYPAEKYGTALVEFKDGSGWGLNQKQTGRSITLRCLRGTELSMRYLDASLLAAAESEQHEWIQLQADHDATRYAQVLPRLRQLADAGNTQAQVLLGLMYRRGEGVPPDPEKGTDYYRRAAERGDPDGQFNLGTAYAASARYEDAVAWLKKAAEQGVTKAQFNLALVYAGDNRLSNPAQAFSWFLRAAQGNHAEAQYTTCLMLAEGAGVARDDVQAWRWCDIAATSGLEKAAKDRDGIAQRMTVPQLQRARQASSEWLNTHRNP